MSHKITAAVEVTVEVEGKSVCSCDCEFVESSCDVKTTSWKEKHFCRLFNKNLSKYFCPEDEDWYLHRCPECIATFPPAGAGEKI